jgi:hypothetical protein
MCHNEIALKSELTKTVKATIALVILVDLIGLCLTEVAKTISSPVVKMKVNEFNIGTRLHLSKVWSRKYRFQTCVGLVVVRW